MRSTAPQRPSQPPTPLAFSLATFAEAIAVSRATIEREVRDGRLHPLHVRGRRLITEAEARAYLQRLTEEGNG